MKSILVIGMGRLGRHFATKMLALGNDVMIVDKTIRLSSSFLQYSLIHKSATAGRKAFFGLWE